MARKPRNHKKSWTKQETDQLRALAEKNTPTRLLGLKLGRTDSSIYSKAHREGISLGPVNQSPYTRR